MLVITRKADESLIIEANGDTIEVAILELAKDKVKIGVKAPREVKIIRSELIAAKTFNVEASQAISKGVLDALLHNTKK